jgi:hypothetical protein
MVTAVQVEQFASNLPRSELHIIGNRVKYRIGRIVFLTIAPDETTMGIGFPREERAAMVEAEPAKFELPSAGDMRYQWIRVRLAALDETEMRELVLDAWRMCAPKRVVAAYDAAQP